MVEEAPRSAERRTRVRRGRSGGAGRVAATSNSWSDGSGVRFAPRGLNPSTRSTCWAHLGKADLGVPGDVQTIAQSADLAGFDQLRRSLIAKPARMVGRSEDHPRACAHAEDRP